MTSQNPKRSTWRTCGLLGCGGILSLCVLITLVSALFGSSGGTDTEATATPTSLVHSQTPGRVSTPVSTSSATPVATPTPAVPIIPGITAADITRNFENKGFRCTMQTGRLHPEWLCTVELPNNVGEARILAHGYSPTRILFVTGTVITWGIPVADAAAPILGYLSTLPYEGSEPQKARAWVENAVRAGVEQSIEIGPVRFTVYGTEQSRILEITPKEGVPAP